MAHIFKVGGTYTVAHSGTYAPVVLVAATLDDTGFSATLTGVSATVGSTFEVSDGGFLDIASFASLSVLTTFDIGDTGTLEIGSLANVSVSSAFDFTNDPGASADLIFASGIDVSALTVGISGFKSGSEIDLAGQTITSTDWDQTTGLLTITTTDGSETLAFQGSYTNADFTHSGSDIIFACFAGGTLIDGPDGPVAVDALVPGDLICVARGPARPVKWIGFRRLDLTRYSDTRTAHPIRIVADAFGKGLPRHDLIVSPDHALLVDGNLIPARMLVNGMTIRRDTQCRSITYYHVELDTHDVLLAEGLPAESYLDTGNRAMFENNDGAIDMRPEFADVAESLRRAAGCCLPLSTDANRVMPVWEDLAGRATALGYLPPSSDPATADPGMVMEINGRQLRSVSAVGDCYVFMVPPVTGLLRLVSRSMVPADDRPWIDDRRRLGVKVRQITLRSDGEHRTIPVDHPMLKDGWWDVEQAGDSMGRWTDGSAALGAFPEGGMLIVELAGRAPSYPAEAAIVTRLAA